MPLVHKRIPLHKGRVELNISIYKIRVIARICLTKWAFTVIIWAVCVLCILFVCDFSGTVLLSHDVLILKKEVF